MPEGVRNLMLKYRGVGLIKAGFIGAVLIVLVILVGLLNVVGVMMCCVGLLFTMPIGFAALMYAYETIFAET